MVIGLLSYFVVDFVMLSVTVSILELRSIPPGYWVVWPGIALLRN